MELPVSAQDTHGTQDEREWELADEDLDRAADNRDLCSTSRPCSCSRCHCR